MAAISRIEVEGLEVEARKGLIGDQVDVSSIAATSSGGSLLRGGETLKGDAAVTSSSSPTLDLNLVHKLP